MGRPRTNPLEAEPFVIGGLPVRLVSYDWRKDEEYAEAEKEGIVEVLQVTRSDLSDPLSGWAGNIHRHTDGSWTAASEKVRYPTREDAAMKIVLDDIAYMESLTDEDMENLMAKIIPAIAMPGVKPPPTDRNALKKKLMR